MFRRFTRLSPSLVISLLALFVAFGGTTYAATGGNFILGELNDTTSPTNLTADSPGKALQIIQNSTATGASALGLNVRPGQAPFTTNSTVKVANLNADSLDGVDSGGFVQGAAGRNLYVRKTLPAGSNEVTLLSFPGFFDLTADCQSGYAGLYLRNRSSAQIDFGMTDGPSPALQISDPDPNVRSSLFYTNVVGEAKIVNLGQSYRPSGGGFPRTRMVTLSIGARGTNEFRPSCLFQAQAFAQGY